MLNSSSRDSISVSTARDLSNWSMQGSISVTLGYAWLDLPRSKIGVVLLVLVAGTSNWSSCPTNMLWIIRSHEPCVAPDAINLELWIM